MISTPNEERWVLLVTQFFDLSTTQQCDCLARLLNAPKLKEVMKRAGVKGAPQIWFVNQAN